MTLAKVTQIWACRMKTSNLSALGSESEILNYYFDKNHRYRIGTLTPAQQALVYDDEQWKNLAVDDSTFVGWVYGGPHVTAVSDPEATAASDYKDNHLTASYELMFVRSHGSPGGHGFYRDEGAVFEWVYCSDYLNYDPEAVFYSFYVCCGSDYTADNYLAGTAAFNPDESGLLSWGSTKTGGMWRDDYYYSHVSSGEVFGEAFKQWFNSVQSTHPSYAPRYWYGMVLIGDAALKVKIQININLAVDYGSLGLWHYDGGAWAQLGGADPEWLCVYDGKLVADYGSLGVWEYNGISWSKIGDANPDNTGNTMVDVSF